MKAPTFLGLAPVLALFLVASLLLPVGSSAQDPASVPDSLAAAAADSVQKAAATADSLAKAAAPPPATAPAAGVTTTPPPASTPPPAAAPEAQAAQTPPPAQQTAPAGPREPFTKGSTRLTLTGGWGRSFDEDYLMLGIGVGRFVRNGLNIGLDFEAWMLGDPGVFKISPNVNYVLARPGRRTKPYGGLFWRRTMIEDAEDLSSVGGRAGAYFSGAGPVMIGGGGVWENYMDCEEKGYTSCSQFYPEFLISASF